MKLLILSTLLAIGGAVLQEFGLHESNKDNDKNSYIFREPLPDVDVHSLGKVVRFCHPTRIIAYTRPNFTGYHDAYSGNGCNTLNTSEIKSFRFLGNRNTEVDGVSLYPGIMYEGKETYVDHSPFTVSDTEVLSVGYTGPSAWTIFEGKNFEGFSTCLHVRLGVDTGAYYDITAFLKIKTIGSLVKGCLTNVTPEMRSDFQKQAAEYNRNNN